jgi:hypothetical protein
MEKGMSVNAEPDALVVATRAFIASMRREFVKKHPGQECFILNLEEYSPGDQRRLKLSIKAAIATTGIKID